MGKKFRGDINVTGPAGVVGHSVTVNGDVTVPAAPPAPPRPAGGAGGMSGRQMEALGEALCSAFDPNSLDRMLRLRLDKDRAAVVPPGALRDVVFALIGVALHEGWCRELVGAARASVPGNPALRKFCEENPEWVGSDGGR